MRQNAGPDRARRVSRAAQPMGVGAAATIVGIMLGVVGAANFGSVLTIAGLAMLLWALHGFGRLGPDPPE